jgi:YidC/Oxa1 family membrane protein insertase
VSILNPLADLVAWAIMHIHAAMGALFGPATGLAWGLSIVILVVLIRVCLIPLFVKQVHAQRKMAQHAPQLQELRKKYKNDKQRLNEETMKFYKENGVNPLAGCLPMIPQMIIFFSLFYVLRAIADWKPGVKPAYGLTVPVLVSAQKATIFGVHLYDKLLFSHQSVSLHVAIVIVLTVIVSASVTFMTVRQSAKRGLMQTNVDPDNPMAATQKYMMYIVPFFSLTGLYWQYGLVLYWVTTNLWTLGQQFFMFRNWTAEDAQAASATAAASGGAARATQGTARLTSGAAKSAAGSGSGAAKTAAGSAKTANNGTRSSGTAKPANSSAKTANNGTRSSGAAKPAAAGSSAGTNGRTSTSTSRSTSATAGAGAARPRTGSARGDAAAAAPNGQNGGAKRGLLRLGRPKPEPVAEPEVPATKVVRQQPSRQARSKRSGKR